MAVDALAKGGHQIVDLDPAQADPRLDVAPRTKAHARHDFLQFFACGAVFFDVTHSLQQPGARSDSAGGRREQITTLARAGMATGLAGLFLEAHPEPEVAKCDGPCALRMSQLEPFLSQLKQIDDLVKGFSVLNTH